MKLLEPTLESVPIARPIPDENNPQGLCLDRGHLALLQLASGLIAFKKAHAAQLATPLQG